MELRNYLKSHTNLKIKQDDIMAILKISRATLNRWEHESQYPLKRVIELVNHYNYSPVKTLLDFNFIQQDDINNNAKSSNTTSSSSTKDITTQKLAIELLKRLSNLNNELTDTFNNELNINKERVKE
jgi:transcriptional regulator with XRE-family HTH domain